MLPIGPYENWNECIADQLNKGKSEESAKKICGYLEQQTKQAVSFNYEASVRPIIRDGKHFAKVYVIDQSMSLNDWGITPQAKNRGASSLIGKPLLGPPEMGHSADWQVGTFVDYDTDEADTIWGCAEVTDEKAWPEIEAGRWKWTSPRVVAKVVRNTPDGKERVEDFIFDHVAFCLDPAFPNSGVKAAYNAEREFCGFSKAFEASLIHSRSIAAERLRDDEANQTLRGEKMENLGRNLGAQDYPWDQCMSDMSDQGYDEDTAAKICAAIKNRTVKHAVQYGLAKDEKEARKFIAEKVVKDRLFGYLAGVLLRASKAKEEDNKLKEEKKEAETGKETETKNDAETPAEINILMADIKALKAENEQLKTTVAKMLEEKHLAKVAEIVDLRVHAGLAKDADRAAEITKMKTLSGEALDQMRVDYAQMIKQAEAFSGPKAKYTPEVVNNRIAEIRQETLGHRDPPDAFKPQEAPKK